MASNIPVIVQGNSFSLAIPLQIYYINGDQMDLQDYTPDPTDEVSVQLKGSRRNYTYTPTIDGNVANIDLTGNELADNYGVVVSVVKANGQRLRSFRTDQFFIVESSDDLTVDDIIEGLEENVIYLNSSIFVAGADGRGIESIVKTSTAGLVDTYTITYTDATTSTYNVTNGAQGAQGADGVGITSIEKTATVGLVDTYTITLSNGQTSTFDVTNGRDGVDLGLATIVDNLTEGGSTNVLSAEQGKVLKSLIGDIIITRWSGVPDGKYYKKNVGEKVIKAYYSSNSKYRTYFASCSKGDIVSFGTGNGNNVPAWMVLDADMYVLAACELYNSSTPKAVPNLTITNDNAAYILINSIGETNNYINSEDSVIARIDNIEKTLSDDIYASRTVEVFPMLLGYCGFNKTDGKIYRDSFTSIAYDINLQGLNAAKVRVPVANGYSIGFEMSDGTWVLAHDNTSLTHRVVTLDVPAGAVRVKGTYVSNQTFDGFFVITKAEIDRYQLKGENIVTLKDNRNSLLPIVENTKRGRFAFQTVGVMDYLNAFDELSYTFRDFVKQTKIGDSQTPLASKADQSIYPINRYTYTKSGANPTKKFVFAGGLHGDSEGWTNNGGDAPQNIVTLYFFLLDMLTHCEDDPLYKKLTDNYVIEVLPVMNPWGVQNHSRYNGRDVDLNRQFPNNWDASTSEHKGSAPLSEAESIAISDFLTGLISNGGFDRYIEIHARGEVLLPSDNRFFGVTPTSDVNKCSAASYYMISKYGGQGGFTGEGANPTVYSWVSFILGVPGCDVECCQSLKNDISTRNSKLLNLQMTDYVKWSVLMQLDVL